MITTTRKEAVGLIEDSMNTDIPLKDESLEKVIYAVNNDLSVRDWVMGMPARFTMDESIQFVRYMAVNTTAEDSVPFTTVNAIFEYERNNLDDANKLLEYSLKINPLYPLAHLMSRVFDSNKLSGDAMKTMRAGLDHVVLEACQEDVTITDEEQE